MSKWFSWGVIGLNIVAIGFNLFFLYDNDLIFAEEFSVSKDFVVSVPVKYYDIITSRWAADEDEFLYCLYGNVTGGDVFVESIRQVSFSSNSTVVKHVRCEHSSDYLGNVHSHPSGNCWFSDTDLFNFGVDDSLLKCLVCGVDKFGCVSKYDVEKLVEVVIR